MGLYTGATREQATRVLALCDKLVGYPRRGTHVGGGRHVSMPQSFRPGAHGWTATMSEISESHSITVIEECVAAQRDPTPRARLTPEEQAELDAAFATRVPDGGGAAGGTRK